MAETAVILVIDKLALLLTEEANLLNGVEEEVDYIKDELESIRSFLKDADEKAEKEDNNNGIKTWVKQVREAAYDIEDIIDEYIIHFAEGQHCQHQGFVKFIHGISDMIRNIKPRRKIALQIQDMKTKLCEIKERSTRYGFNSWEQRSSNFMQTLTWCDPRMASYFVKGDEVVGVESARDELIGWLVAGGSERKVISVVGMGGLGKTTVAKIVYDNEIVAAYFECHAWITVSQLYSRNELLRNVIRQFCQTRKESTPEGIDAMDEFLLITKLRQYLQEKRYVVVFDDVWKVDFWGDIEHALPNNINGSRIMITTRIKDVSDFCEKSSFVQVHELQPLPPNKAWELFCMKTFHFEFDGNCPLELQKLSHAIVERCGGLPLAIVAIGGLLSTKEKMVSEWKKLHDSLGSELEYNPHLTNITKILCLSYHDLPHYLKSCFLYLGIYPEDYPISHPTLTTQWIAEGFIKGKKGKTLEEVANEYLADLVRRNLVQKSWGEFNGVNKRYRIHDLTREIILSKFEELSFCHVLEGKDSSFSRKTRRLSILSGMCNTNVHTIRKSRVRSLFLFNVDQLPRSFLVRLFENFKLLKVLDFGGAPFEVLPEEVGCLLHLSYLSVRATKIKVIPKSIGKLINLLTFDLSLTLVRELPIEITKLRKLRHLFAYFCSPGIDFCFDLLQGVRIHEGIGCLEK